MKNGLIYETVKDAVRLWWVSLLVGLMAIILGIWTISTPDRTFVALIYVFILAFLIGGISEIIFAFANRKTLTGWGWSLASGIIDILFAILLMSIPVQIISLLLIYFVGFWIMFHAIWTIGEAAELQRFGVKGWGWLLVFGILSVIFSIMFIFSPMFGGVFIIAFISIALITYGIFRIYFAFMLKSMHKYIGKPELLEKSL